MHYFFLDESYAPVARGQKRIVMAAWAIEQHRWGQRSVRRFDLFNPPIADRICLMLESLNGVAFVAAATLDESLFRSRVIAGTDDIPSMARSDLIWSMSAIFTLGTLILQLLRHGQDVGTIDVHFDFKNLKFPHSEAWQKTLRHLVVKEAKRFASERGSDKLSGLRIRRIAPVAKTDHRGLPPDKFSMGIWVSDKLCAHVGQVGKLKCPRVSKHDMSDSVRRTTQQFEGKSFYES